MNSSYLSLNSKVTLAFMGLAIVLMLGISLVQRFNNPSLVVASRVGVSAEEAESNRLSSEIATHMQELKENPNDVAKLMHTADLLIQSEQWQSAETFVRRALAADANTPNGHYVLGMILFNQEKHNEAAVELEKVFAIKEDSSARYSLGVLNIYYLNNAVEGRKHLQKALEDPNLPKDLKDTIMEELNKPIEPTANAQ